MLAVVCEVARGRTGSRKIPTSINVANEDSVTGVTELGVKPASSVCCHDGVVATSGRVGRRRTVAHPDATRYVDPEPRGWSFSVYIVLAVDVAVVNRESAVVQDTRGQRRLHCGFEPMNRNA